MPKKKKDRIATDLARAIWRTRGYCEARGYEGVNCGQQLQGAHIIGVGTAKRIQSDLRNGLCLCSNHHRYYHDHPHDFVEFINRCEVGKYYNVLKKKQIRRATDQKIDWDDRIDFLKEILRAINKTELTIEEAWEYES